MSSVAELTSPRAKMTAGVRSFFLAIAAFHSETTRARLNPMQFHSTLEDLLMGYETEAQRAGLDWELYVQTKYALVGLADDLALHSDWDHSEMWNDYLLELRHFNTSFAGAEFFDRLQRLRQKLGGVHDPALRDQMLGAIEIYYTCLQLGFQGRYRGHGRQQLEGLKNQLVNLLWPHGEQALRSRAWADAYSGTGSGRIARRGRFWWWPIPLSIVAVIGLWFLFSFTQTMRVGEIVEDVGKDAPATSPDEEDEE